MKGIVIVSGFWTSFFSLGTAIGITIFPFIFVYKKDLLEDKELINHEQIHFRQAIEMLILPFYIWYFIEFLVRFLQYKNWNLAYRHISFEREAYSQDADLEYLSKRKFWSFLHYFKTVPKSSNKNKLDK